MKRYFIVSSGDTLDSKVSGRFGNSARKTGDADGGRVTGRGVGSRRIMGGRNK